MKTGWDDKFEITKFEVFWGGGGHKGRSGKVQNDVSVTNSSKIISLLAFRTLSQPFMELFYFKL